MRGLLKSFTDLPLCVQQKFKRIATEIKKLDPEIKEVFVYGSYFWGSWDDQSDYDVRINQSTEISIVDFKIKMGKEHDLKVDLMVMRPPRKEMNLIKIPV